MVNTNKQALAGHLILLTGIHHVDPTRTPVAFTSIGAGGGSYNGAGGSTVHGYGYGLRYSSGMALEVTLVMVLGVVVAWDQGTDSVTTVVMSLVTVLLVKEVGEVVEKEATVDSAMVAMAMGSGYGSGGGRKVEWEVAAPRQQWWFWAWMWWRLCRWRWYGGEHSH